MNVELLRVDGDRQMPPSAMQLGRDRQADDPAADHGDGWPRPAPMRVPCQRSDLIRDDTGTSEAQGDPGTAVPVVVKSGTWIRTGSVQAHLRS